MVRRIGYVCYSGHGALDIDNDAHHLSTTACQQLCRNTAGCQGVVVERRTSDDEPTLCYRRREIEIAGCESGSPYDLLYDPTYYAPSTALLTLLNTSYSVALYGVPGALDPQFRLIWPTVLSRTAGLDLVRIRCNIASDNGMSANGNEVSFYYSWPQNFMQQAGLWLHRPVNELAFTFEDNAWVEVVHCAYTNSVTERTPMYFFTAPGSGLRLNVGRSLRLRQFHDEDTDPHFAAHQAIDRGDFARAEQLLGFSLSQYDSVQYPLYTASSWRGEMFTEIAMLNWHNERDQVTVRLTEQRIRCGPIGELRQCRPDEPAVAQIAGGCSAHLPPAVQTLRDSSSCEDTEWWIG